jgi:hypothetical protein
MLSSGHRKLSLSEISQRRESKQFERSAFGGSAARFASLFECGCCLTSCGQALGHIFEGELLGHEGGVLQSASIAYRSLAAVSFFLWEASKD